MKLLNIAIALGAGVATAAGLYLVKINKNFVIGSTALVVGAGLIIHLKDGEDQNKKGNNYEYFFNRAQDKFEVANYERECMTSTKH